MYIPRHFEKTDPALLLEVMQRYPFAHLISQTADGLPWVSQLPLVWVSDGEHGALNGHFARANPHWREMDAERSVLAAFSGPHAYVAPAWYETALAVPTWNYVAVHAYGRMEFIDDADAKDALLKRLIAQHDPDYIARWRAMPKDYQVKMLAGIVGFRLHIERLEGKFKLSQNRPSPDQAHVREAHGNGTAIEQDLAYWMGRLG